MSDSHAQASGWRAELGAALERAERLLETAPAEAEALARQALQLLPVEADALSSARTGCVMGRALLAGGRIRDALSYLRGAMEHARRSGEARHLVHCMLHLGRACNQISWFDEAERVLRDGLTLAMAEEQLQELPALWGELASSAEHQEDLNSMLHCLSQALSCCMDECMEVCYSLLLRRARAFVRQGEMEQARMDLDRAEVQLAELRKTDFATRYLAMFELNQGYLLLATRQFAEGRRCARQAAHNFQESGDAAAVCDALMLLGQLEAEAGHAPLALPHLRKALEMSLQLGSRERERNIRLTMADLMHDLGHYEEAYELYDQVLELGTSIFSEEKQRLHEEVEARFETEVHQLKHSQLSHTNRELEEANRCLQDRTSQLTEALEEVQVLSGLLPICSSCRKVRDDKGYWQRIDQFLAEAGCVHFDRCLCPECANKAKEEA